MLKNQTLALLYQPFKVKEGLLIYGSYGYTGQLIVEHALSKGLKPVLAGRDANRLAQQAAKFNLNYVAFDLSNADEVAEKIKDFKVVLHCAGPFKYTAKIMTDVCIKTKTHYLDITGEYQVFESIFRKHDEAKDAEVLLMPGVGFDVVPSDCLAAYLKDKMQTASSLELALWQKGGKLSHGTAITVAENLSEGCTIRKNGKLVNIPSGSLTRSIKIEDQSRIAVAIPWGDVSTAFRSTKIPNIIVYNFLPKKVIDGMKMTQRLNFFFRLNFVKRFLISRIKKRPAGPSAAERETAQTLIWGEAKNPLGISIRAVLQLPEGYTLTALTSVKIAQSILEKEPPHGALTPSQVFGKDFILQFPTTSISDIK